MKYKQVELLIFEALTGKHKRKMFHVSKFAFDILETHFKEVYKEKFSKTEILTALAYENYGGKVKDITASMVENVLLKSASFEEPLNIFKMKSAYTAKDGFVFIHAADKARLGAKVPKEKEPTQGTTYTAIFYSFGKMPPVFLVDSCYMVKPKSILRNGYFISYDEIENKIKTLDF